MSELPDDRKGWKALLGYVQRAFRTPEDAEDALQSAFVRLETYRATQPVKNPTAFLVRTAMNIAVDQSRRGRVRGEFEDRQAHLPYLVDDAPLQEAMLVARERLARVAEALDALSPRTREIFLMNRLDEMKYGEIAERLGISVSAVEKHMAKAILHVTRLRRQG